MQHDVLTTSVHSPRTFDTGNRHTGNRHTGSRHTGNRRLCRCDGSLRRREPQHCTTCAVDTTTRHLELHLTRRQSTCAIGDPAPTCAARLAHHINGKRARVADEQECCAALCDTRCEATCVPGGDVCRTGDHEFETVECCCNHLSGSHPRPVRSRPVHSRLHCTRGTVHPHRHQTVERHPPLGSGGQTESRHTDHTDPRPRL